MGATIDRQGYSGKYHQRKVLHFLFQAPGLLNFSPHSDLGMVVGAIRREFEKAESLQVRESLRETECSK